MLGGIAPRIKRIWWAGVEKLTHAFAKRQVHVYVSTCLDCGSKATFKKHKPVDVMVASTFNSDFKCTSCDSVNVCIQTTTVPQRRTPATNSRARRWNIYGYNQCDDGDA